MNNLSEISNVQHPTVFKSEAGRRMILAHYRKLLDSVDFEYTERYVETTYGSTYILESGSPDFPERIVCCAIFIGKAYNADRKVNKF